MDSRRRIRAQSSSTHHLLERLGVQGAESARREPRALARAPDRLPREPTLLAAVTLCAAALLPGLGSTSPFLGRSARARNTRGSMRSRGLQAGSYRRALFGCSCVFACNLRGHVRLSTGRDPAASPSCPPACRGLSCLSVIPAVREGSRGAFGMRRRNGILVHARPAAQNTCGSHLVEKLPASFRGRVA